MSGTVYFSLKEAYTVLIKTPVFFICELAYYFVGFGDYLQIRK
jgi:hypothetical protein